MSTRLSFLLLLTLVAADERGNVVNPQYTSWAKQKIGASVTMKITTSVAGNTTVGTIVQTLQERTRDHAIVEVTTKLEAQLVELNLPARTVTILARVPRGELDKLVLPDGVNGQIEQSGTESISVAGKKLHCKLYDFRAAQEGTTFTGRVWRNDTIPGGVVKAEMEFEGAQHGTMRLELDSIDPG